MTGNLPERPLRSLAERLKWWRINAGYKTRKSLFLASGIPESTIGDLESGRQKSSTKLPTLARFLKINANYLETGEGDPLDVKALPPTPVANNRLVELVSDDEVSDFNDAEMELVQFKIREAIRYVRGLRPKRKQAKTG